MTDRDALLRTIVENPDDDTPRLVYADWLDDHGEAAEAEFVRVQVELEPVRDRLDDPHVRRLIRRAELLEGQVRGSNAPPAGDPDPWMYWDIRFRRGMPDSAQVDVYTLAAYGPALRAEHPTVRELAVFDFNGGPGRLDNQPALADLDVIELGLVMNEPEDAAEVVANPHVSRAGTLRLWIGWNDGLAEALAGADAQPDRIELVQLLGGVTAGPRRAESDRQAFDLVRRVNDRAGRQLAHLVQPFHRTFPLCGRGDDDEPGIYVGGGMYAGRLPNGTPALCRPPVVPGDGWLLATFYETGELIGVNDVRPGVPQKGDWRDTMRWLTDTLGLTPAAIRVREFDHRWEFGARLWSRRHLEPGRDHFTADEPELYEWLRGENFDLGNYPTDWRGEVHTT